MKTKISPIQIALITGAIVAGVLLDRLIQAASGPVASRERRAAVAENGTAPSAGSAGSASDANLTTSSNNTRAGVSSSPRATTKSSLDSVLAEKDGRQRIRDLQAYISSMPTAGFGDALKRIRQITNSNERELAERLLVAQWAATDPDGALQFAAGNRGFEYVAEDVFGQLAGADFQAALNRALAIPGSDLRYHALRGLLSYQADTDPQAALKQATSFGEFRGNEPLASAVYRQWAARDPQAAAAQAASEAQGEGWRSPVNSVVQTWAEQDPVAAANWSLGLGDAQAQARSISQVMRQWAREDPKAASNWIQSLDAGVSRDAAVSGMAQSLVGRDPQTALSWIGTITDDSTRNRALQRVSGEIMWRDPQNGAAMLQAAGLPADQIRDPRRGRGR